ncbi:MAG: PEGA domain-containing protein [Deltaproteobacteria bacterium]|nr:PEGA domain-containing protein [Deltaproteobacteria bacterium]
MRHVLDGPVRGWRHAAMAWVGGMVMAAWLGAAAGGPEPVPERTVMVFVDEGTVPPPLAARLRDALAGVTAESAEFRGRPAPSLVLDEILLSMGCQALDARCLRQLCTVMRVDALGMVTVRVGSPRLLELQWMDGCQGQPQRAVQRPLGGEEADVAAVTDAVRARLGRQRPAHVSVASTPAGASVFLDGAAAGVTPLNNVPLPPGAHRVRVALAGHVAEERDVAMKAGRSSVAVFQLVPEPAAGAPPPPAHPPSTPAPAARGVEGRTGVPRALAFTPGALAAAAGGMVLGAGALLGLLGGTAYALVWTIQATRPVGRRLVVPFSLAGAATAAVGGVILLLAAALLAGAGAWQLLSG